MECALGKTLEDVRFEVRQQAASALVVANQAPGLESTAPTNGHNH